MGEGDIPVVISITAILTEINEYKEKEGVSKFVRDMYEEDMYKEDWDRLLGK